MVKTLFLALMFSVILGHSKNVDKFKFNYILNGDTIYIECIEKENNLKNDRFYNRDIKCVKHECIVTSESKYIVYLSNVGNMVIFKKENNIYQKFQNIQSDIDQIKSGLFLSNFEICDVGNDGIKELLVKFTEYEGALFEINIYSMNLVGKKLNKVLETGPLFQYPAWNPLHEKEEVKIEKSVIIVPYCSGCESGKEGELKWKTISYNKTEDSYAFD